MNIKNNIPSLLFAAFLIPLGDSAAWQTLSFSSIPSNKVTFQKDRLNISVNKSASPLIYPFSDVKKINSLSIRFKIVGAPISLKEGITQGDKNFDDFSLRFGLVKKGSKTLNWMQRQLAAPWILKMYSLAPEGLGIDNIHFFVATQQKKLVGKHRIHPLSEYYIEEYLKEAKPGNEITMEKTFKVPIETLALWISADGDDTSSKYELEIREIKFNYK